MVAVIDYGSGNIFSLCKAIERTGNEYVITADKSVISRCTHIVLPGVGDASDVMKGIEERGLRDVITNLKCPVLGICIGMQVLCKWSEEGNTSCLSVYEERVKKLEGNNLKIPHMGWNSLTNLNGELFQGVPEGEWFYFVHSYAPEAGVSTSSVTEYGELFSSSLKKDNFFGTQFHPEKSGAAGEIVLSNFLNINYL